MFAASFSKSNDIPEGGTGELQVAMATRRQREWRLVALCSGSRAGAETGVGAVDLLLLVSPRHRRACDAQVIVQETPGLWITSKPELPGSGGWHGREG